MELEKTQRPYSTVYDMTEEARRHNSTYPKGGVSCSKDSFVVAESLVLRMNICGKSPALRVAAKRWVQVQEDNDTADNLLLKDKKKKNDIMNSPRTKLHICKPRHTSRCFSLQKSSFLADAPQEIDTFVVI